MARTGLHVRRLQPRRLRAAVACDGDLRRRGVLDRRHRRAPTRRGSAGDLGDVPAGARRRAVGVVDPRADARAPALHRPALAPRLGGAEPDAEGLARAPASRRLGERPRQRRPRRVARDAARRVRADPQSRSDLAAQPRAPRSSPRSPSSPRRTARSRPPATTTCSSSTHRSRDASPSGRGRTRPWTRCSSTPSP